MQISRANAMLFFLLLSMPLRAESAAWYDPLVLCNEFGHCADRVYHNPEPPKCITSEGTVIPWDGPPNTFENCSTGIVLYDYNYKAQFHLTDAANEGSTVVSNPPSNNATSTSISTSSEITYLYNIVVDWEIQTHSCTVHVNKTKCDSCAICSFNETAFLPGGEGTAHFSADCANVRNGTIVECQSLLPIFFPLQTPSAQDRRKLRRRLQRQASSPLGRGLPSEVHDSMN